MTEIDASDYGKWKRRRKMAESTDRLTQAIRAIGLPDAEREIVFHPSRRWRLDLGWRDKKIAVEIHGGVYTRGRHTRGDGFTEDREKMSEAAILGWIVLEVTPEMIRNGKAIDLIERAMKARK